MDSAFNKDIQSDSLPFSYRNCIRLFMLWYCFFARFFAFFNCFFVSRILFCFSVILFSRPVKEVLISASSASRFSNSCPMLSLLFCRSFTFWSACFFFSCNSFSFPLVSSIFCSVAWTAMEEEPVKVTVTAKVNAQSSFPYFFMSVPFYFTVTLQVAFLPEA